MMVSAAKVAIVAVVLGVAAWMPGILHVPMTLWAGAILACVFGAQIVLEHDRIREATQAEPVAKARERPVRALVVGAGAVGRTLAENLEADGRYEVLGFVDDASDHVDLGRWTVLGNRADTAALVERLHVDEVLLAYAPTWQQRLAEQLAASYPEVRVRVVPSPYEAMMRTGAVESVADIALIRLVADCGSPARAVKRLVDASTAAIGLIVLSPLLLLLAILIKLTSRGPVIFAQERVGRYGKDFVLYKLRTMVHHAEAQTGPVLSRGRLDHRLTQLGRFLRMTRLDEIPQLWNVLSGDMSLVGPRPERPCFVERFESQCPIYAKRHQVRPGITGLAQVHGGYHTDWRDKLRFDLIYVSHQSLMLDISIVLRTILVVCLPNRRRFDRK